MKKLNLKWVSDSIGNDYEKWKQGDIVLISAQTGTGKTWFVKNVLLDSLKSYQRLLFVCNRTNLKRQLKKDLLEKFGELIPETLEELDKITTIQDRVTITSYHAISNSIKDGIYDSNGKKTDFSLFDYIVFDECHFIFADGGFNNKTRFAYQKIVHEYHPRIIKIFISATMHEIRDPILRCTDRVFGKKPTIHEYTTGNDYSFVKPKYFKEIESVINLIKNDNSDEKWLVFISDIERNGKPIQEALGDEKCSLIKSGTKSNELNSIVNNSKFEKKVLICTKAMDNGINIDDPKLKHIVIMAWDRITFIQMLGRKRIDINNADDVNLYIATRYKKSFIQKLRILQGKKAEIDLYDNKMEFCKKYDNDLKDFGRINDLFYREVKTGEIKVNLVGQFRLLEDIKFAEKMIEAFEEEGEFAFIHEQLSWLGLTDGILEENLLDDVLVNEEIESLEEYLHNLIGKKLFKKEQQELKEYVTKDFDNMIKKLQGRHSDRNPGLSVLNKLIVICDIPYVVKSRQETKRIEGKVKKITYWFVESLHDDDLVV